MQQWSRSALTTVFTEAQRSRCGGCESTTPQLSVFVEGRLSPPVAMVLILATSAWVQ